MSDSEDFQEELETPEVELGFICEEEAAPGTLMMHADPDWAHWDGGKVGGKPSWLCPATAGLPTTAQLSCAACETPLSFLLQIYCPLDDQPDAFHRSLYLFVCRASGCTQQGDGKVFRSQLPRENAFYASESGALMLQVPEERVELCALCGQRAVFKCSACHVAQYCCKAHQKDHWSAGGHKQSCAQCAETQTLVESQEAQEKLRSQGSKWLFPEHELEIDHEPDTSVAANEYEAKLLTEFEKSKVIGGTKAGEGEESDPFTDDSALDVSQRELNEALGHTRDQDPEYVHFLTRVALAKDQVLRYARWEDAAVLWVHSQGMRQAEQLPVPPCERCGGPRKFEFQVLPQLLNYLNVDQQGSLGNIATRSCEWGTLVVYTCAQSCPLETQCSQEFLHYQPAYAGEA